MIWYCGIMDDKGLARAIAVYSAVKFAELPMAFVSQKKETIVEIAKYFTQFIEGK